MIFYKNFMTCAAIILIIVLHILSALLKKPLSSILAYVNIGLHIILVALLLSASAELSELAVLFMGSLLVYLASGLIYRKISEKRSEGGGDSDI